MDLFLTISRTNGLNRQVTLKIDDGESLSGDYEFNPDGQRLVKSFGDLRSPDCPLESIKAIGEAMFRGVFAGKLRDALFEGIRKRVDSAPDERFRLRLTLPVDPELRQLPWEALGCPQTGILGIRGIWSLHHEPSSDEEQLAAFPDPEAARLAILIVAPVGTGLDFSSEIEAIRLSAKRLGPNHNPQVMPGAITLQTLKMELGSRKWDIVHYIGHGVVNPDDGGVEIMVNDDDAKPVTVSAERFANCFDCSGVRLAVLNCCSSAAQFVNKTYSLAGMGPYLRRVGVPAMVGMRYKISDVSAKNFSSSFYEALFHLSPGRLDDSVQKARSGLETLMTLKETRSFIAPVLYCDPKWVTLAVPASLPPPPPPIQPIPPQGPIFELPEPLTSALKTGNCLVIAGRELLLLGQDRFFNTGTSPSSTLEGMAQEVSRTLDARYPRMKRLDEMKGVDEEEAWHGFELFCQYYETREAGNRLKLEANVGARFEGDPPTIFRRMATWNVKGMVYTHLDGYLRKAAAQSGAWDIKTSPSEALIGQQPPLVLLRGWPRDEGALYLTRDDAWKLFRSIATVHRSLRGLARENAEVVLFLGASPSDGMLQYFINMLFDEEKYWNGKPMFFACEAPDPVTEACWRRFKKLTWLGNTPLDRVIQSVDRLLPKRT